MKTNPQTNLTYLFIIVYITILIYILIFRVILDAIRGRSEQTPIEILSAIVVFIIIPIAFNILWIFKDRGEDRDKFIWLFALLFFIIFFFREVGVRYFHWSPIDVIGFGFILIVTRHIWKIDKYSGYLCIFGVVALTTGVGIDVLLDQKVFTAEDLLRILSITEESFELFATLFFLHSFMNLKVSVFGPTARPDRIQ
jgi:hypothetical protein